MLMNTSNIRYRWYQQGTGFRFGLISFLLK